MLIAYFFIDIVITYCIKYELDEFGWNWMSIYVLYNVASVFVNDMVCDRDILCWDHILTLLVIGIIKEDG